MNKTTLNTLLQRGVAEVIDSHHLEKRLQSDAVLRVKLGIDPSAPDLHIGHALTLRKLRAFQDAGHTAVLIIGDYTAQIGDPTGKNEARSMLTPEVVKQNAENYLAQAYKILDKTKTEVHYQSEWFNPFTLRNVIELMAKTTVAHILSHETFRSRLEQKSSLHMHELLYPLLQGYDSVMVKADVEIGGNDQKFNVLMGRVVQRAHNMNEQDVLLLHYLPGIDGQEKMSKSLGNTINLTDTPSNMFGKIMSLPDTLISTYYELATQVSPEELDRIKSEALDASINPRDTKMQLAQTIVGEYHSKEAAEEAAQSFEQQFRHKQVPDEIERLVLPPNTYELDNLLTSRSTLVSSKSEVRRLIQQRGIKKNGNIVVDTKETVSPADGESVLLQVGSRRFLRVQWKKS